MRIGWLLGGQFEVDLAIVQRYPGNLNTHPVTQTVDTARTLTHQPVADRVVVIIIVGQSGNMYKALDIHAIELDEDAERGHRTDGALEHLAHLVEHVLALEPVDHVARGLVGTAVGHRAMIADHQHVLMGVGKIPGLAPGQHMTYRAVHEQVGIAPDRRSEMRIGLLRQTKVTEKLRAVTCLLHRAQQNGLYQVRIRPPLRLCQHLGEMTWLGFITATQLQTHLGQKVAQFLDLVAIRGFVDAVQRRDLMFMQETRGTDIGRYHALLDHLVGIVALNRHDLLDLASLAEHDACLNGIEIDGPAAVTRLAQYLIELVKVSQVRHQCRVPSRQCRLPAIQHGIHIIIDQTRM